MRLPMSLLDTAKCTLRQNPCRTTSGAGCPLCHPARVSTSARPLHGALHGRRVGGWDRRALWEAVERSHVRPYRKVFTLFRAGRPIPGTNVGP